jgi:hypothetical protein
MKPSLKGFLISSPKWPHLQQAQGHHKLKIFLACNLETINIMTCLKGSRIYYINSRRVVSLSGHPGQQEMTYMFAGDQFIKLISFLLG